ncbi:hypothetical protein ACQUQP_15280 [Marinobacterium sp. YM272]|uniref:hypothetical protein n=1 Tax=Marinobacterium sp. YM272 TaxID=3421654 RepID=UPI003D7FC3AF
MTKLNPTPLGLAAALLLSLAHSAALAEPTQQQHVHQMAHQVMPFELGASIHLFKMTETGGRQRVVLREGQDPEQIALIQRHLKHEAMRFQQGDFGDPARLHGEMMPGLQALQKGAKQIRIHYSPLPNGAEITFETDDIHLLTAIHRWFGAQLSEHGADAKAE